MNRRMADLLKATREELRDGHAPLSARFIAEWDVSPEEHDQLCALIEKGTALVLDFQSEPQCASLAAA